ncbi:MAG: DUF72 domain-containing protein [Planctomycetota bacterium]|nr:DUF72 domain-containing protein [Planctomycetota bacterium]
MTGDSSKAPARGRWQEKIRIGTSGYNYPGWVGPFYPDGTRREQMLSVYADCFGTVELNFTYYGIPRPATLSRMTRQTPESFVFFVKAHKGITHDGEPEKHVGPFRTCIEPLSAAGRLGGVLLQFPQAFRRSPESLNTLRSIAESMKEFPLVAEFRHASWVDDGVFEFLRETGIAFCCVDEPRIEGLVPPIAAATSSIGYVRLHSRDGNRWYSGEGRYDYDYSREELMEWIDKLKDLAQRTTAVYVFFNNCHGAQAAQNALLMQRLLGLDSSPPPRPRQKDLFL